MKSLIEDLTSLLQERRGYPPGTVRTWAGQDYEKQKSGEWVKVPKGRKGAASSAPSAKPTTTPDIANEKTVPPPTGEVYEVDPTKDKDKDGIADAARVGICGKCVFPPGSIPRLPNLTSDERDVETRFAEAFEKKSDALVKEYQKRLDAGEIGDGPNVYSTDDAKLLSPDYNPSDKSDEERKEAMGRYNAVVHQTANALAKKAFLNKLDELAKLPEDDPKRSILVTSGGVAAGKGYALGNVEETKALSGKVGAIWDAAGEQNGTENPWVLEEARKRGLKPIFVFVDSDPKETWENPQRGVVERARKKGRMVDARLFADSYAIGARNFAAFHEQSKDQAEFVFLTSRGGPPRRVDGVPEEALKQNEDQIYERASKVLAAKDDLPVGVKRGGSIGKRIWK